MVWFWAMVVSLALWHIAQYKIFRNAPGRMTKSCAVAYSEEIFTDFHYMAFFPYSGSQHVAKFAAVAQSTEGP
jgi:hypothetical protein